MPFDLKAFESFDLEMMLSTSMVDNFFKDNYWRIFSYLHSRLHKKLFQLVEKVQKVFKVVIFKL